MNRATDRDFTTDLNLGAEDVRIEWLVVRRGRGLPG